jgi:phosphatidylinositol alpha-mannosyltransferase
MRIALVSPYSWSYPGGVTRHIEALAEQYITRGHEVRVLTPIDPLDGLARVAHRGALPQQVELPPYVLSLGRTVGIRANGSVSNLQISPAGVRRLLGELRSGGYDVCHVHEPVAPLASWYATKSAPVPLVGTFHSYSTSWLPNTLGNVFGARRVLNHLRVRIAVSEAAAWTGRRWFGGRYRIIPNGVHVDPELASRIADAHWRLPDGAGGPLRIVFVGQAVERKGLPLLLRAFEALREHVPAQLTVIGPTPAELEPLILDPRGIRILGKVDEGRKRAELGEADLLCAPSLGGESFGMVLTEAFAAGATVVASDIAGYRDVVTDGVDGVLVPPGDPAALARELLDLAHEPERRHALAREAARTAERFAWERVAEEVLHAYEDALAIPVPLDPGRRRRLRLGLDPADLLPPVPPERLPSLERPIETATRGRRVRGYARRAGAVAFVLGGLAAAYYGLEQIGIGSVARALISSSPAYVLLALLVMGAAMVMRSVSWHAILEAALPKSPLRWIDALRGTMIGVLMSATLPARLGEPSRALVVARRAGRPRESFPIVLGTLVSQTMLNILALVILGAIMFSSVDFFSGHQDALIATAVAPVVLLAAVLIAPALVRYGASSRSIRVSKLFRELQLALHRVRAGLVVFRDPKLGGVATVAQLAAWALQALSCYLLLCALGLQDRTGFAAAAGVLFAVNVTAVLPATPANIGVFQAACAAVLAAGWHIGLGTGVAYGVILQAVELATAVLMGMPALLREGTSWREVRLRAMHATPIKLPPRPEPRSGRATASSGAAGSR